MKKLTSRKHAFTLVEIMIVMAIIGIVIAIAVPALIRAREVSQARGCQANLAKIDGAADQYIVEKKLPSGATINFPADLINVNTTGYLKAAPKCPAGGTYDAFFVADVPVKCSIGENAGSPYAPHILLEPVPAPPGG